MTPAQILSPLSRFIRVSCFLALASAGATLTAGAQAQNNTPPVVNVPTSAPPPLFANATPPDPSQAHMLHEMAKERSVLRQKEIMDDTNQLLDLAKQLKDAVNKSSKDQLSLNVVNTASEIEKLAKSVKEKMRDGN